MSDAKRILEDGSSFERSVIASADDDSPSADLEAKILAALPAPATSPSPPKPGPLTVRRVVLALAALGLGALVASSVSRKSETHTVIEAPRSSSPLVVSEPKAEELAPPVVPPIMTVTPDSLPSAPSAGTKPESKTKAVPTMESGAKIDDGSSLAREIALLDAVKSKLGAGTPGEASRALDGYDAEFPHGALRPEATVLRIRTLLMQGNRAAAEKLADAFLAKHPGSVHASRVRALLAD